MRQTRGFTLIEVAVATAIIGLLATMVLVTFNNQQTKARDTARSSKAVLIADALERYYHEHGEYPSVRAMLSTYSGNTGDVVASLLSITEKSNLVMPKAAGGTTNSITATLDNGDTLAYVAQSTIGNDNCQGSVQGGCDEFTLSYKEEATGNIITIESVNKGRTDIAANSPLQAPSKPTISAVQSGTNLVATSSAPACVSGSGTTARYSFREQVGSNGWGNWTAWQTGNTYTRGSNANNTGYSFQSRVRCESATLVGDTSSYSDAATVTYYVMPATPSGPTTAAQSGSNVTGTSATVSCNYGTPQYMVDYRTNSGSWVSGSWGVTYVRTVAGLDSTLYGFRTTARCVNGTQTATGAAGAEDTVTYYAMPATPSTPTISAVQSTPNVIGTSTTVSCNYGSAQYLIDYRTNSGSWVVGSWGVTYVRTVAGAGQTTFGFRVTARCVNGTQTATGSTSAEGTVFYYAMPAAPAAPSTSIGSNGTTVTGTASTVSCNYGSAQYLIDYRTNDGSWSAGSWGSGTTRSVTASDGVKYGFRTTARCVNSTEIATGSTGSESTYVEPIATPGAPSVSTTTVATKNWTWSASACPSGTSPYYQYQFYNNVNGTYSWTGTGSATATNVAGGSQGVTYGIYVQQRCYNSYTTSSYSGSGMGGTYVVPVVHVAVEYAAFKLITGAYPSITMKSYTGTCASGLDRLVGIKGDFGNTGTWTYYTGFVGATDGLTLDVTSQSVASGSTFEVNTRARCQNQQTGYYTDAAGEVTAPMTYDIGNLYNRGSSKYNISCAPTSISSYCAAGYNSSGTKNTTNTTALACTVKANTYSYIVDTATRFSAYFSFGTNNLCYA